MDQSKDATGVTQDFDLLAFVQTGTVARREVEIYTDHEAAKRCQEIQDRLDELDDVDPEADGPLGAAPADDREALEAEAETFLERLRDSKMTWTVRALSSEEIERSFDEVPAVKAPVPPSESAPKAVRDQWADAVAGYQRERAKADAERRLVLISYGVTGIETPAGSTDRVSVEQLRSLRSKPHGQGWIDKLYAAMDEASSEEVEPPVPTSPGRSTSSRG